MKRPHPQDVRAWYEAALDFFFPSLHACPGCGMPDTPITMETVGLCERCFSLFPRVKDREMPQNVWVAAHYEHAVCKLIHQLKYKEAQYLAPVMAWQMAEGVGRGVLSEDAEEWVIVPVPLHPSRQRHRGYNQSQLLARHLTRYLKIPREDQALVRNKATTPLYRLNRQERKHTLANSMQIHPQAINRLHQKKILLVDDIYTTGATAAACIKALKPAKPETVMVAAFALADLQSHSVS